MNTRSLLIAAISAALLFVPTLITMAEEGGGPPPMPPARSIPGITAPDAFPGGCVDCHVVRKDIGRDVRISTILKEWTGGVPEPFLEKAQRAASGEIKLKGKHPSADWAFADIPNACLTCHKADSETVPPLSGIMHIYHLTGEGNPYLAAFGGECTLCHKLEPNGRWSLSSGPEHPQ